jgi:hypothetical protein
LGENAMPNIDEKETKFQYLSSILIAKIDTGILLNCRALRDHHESLTVSEWLSDISQHDFSCSDEAGDNYYSVSKKKPGHLSCVLCQ